MAFSNTISSANNLRDPSKLPPTDVCAYVAFTEALNLFKFVCFERLDDRRVTKILCPAPFCVTNRDPFTILRAVESRVVLLCARYRKQRN